MDYRQWRENYSFAPSAHTHTAIRCNRIWIPNYRPHGTRIYTVYRMLELDSNFNLMMHRNDKFVKSWPYQVSIPYILMCSDPHSVQRGRIGNLPSSALLQKGRNNKNAVMIFNRIRESAYILCILFPLLLVIRIFAIFTFLFFLFLWVLFVVVAVVVNRRFTSFPFCAFFQPTWFVAVPSVFIVSNRINSGHHSKQIKGNIVGYGDDGDGGVVSVCTWCVRKMDFGRVTIEFTYRVWLENTHIFNTQLHFLIWQIRFISHNKHNKRILCIRKS